MKLNHSASPEMSVVLATPDRYETICKTIRHLRAQKVKKQLEVVIVAPSADGLNLDESELKDFLQFRVVEIGAVRSIAEANAAGIRQASAPVVAMAEDHSYPEPGWADALIKAHRKPWAAVGPEVRNANPHSMISWADFLLGYGPWIQPAAAGVVHHLPGHNSSYKRAVLLEYGPELETMLEAESVLHWDLQAKGYALYLEPRAKISHVNFEFLSSWIKAQFHSARMFAATRARRWLPLQRLLYACATPFIPGVRLWRILRHLRGQQRNLQPRVLPPLLLGLAVSAVGEMAGYALGTGNARQKLTSLEFHRDHHIAERHRQAKVG